MISHFFRSMRGENGSLIVVPIFFFFFFQEYCLLPRICGRNLRFDTGNNVVHQNQHFDLFLKIVWAAIMNMNKFPLMSVQ